MVDVFISYARASHALAQQAAARLTSAGYEVWWDEDLPAHRVYAEVIEERLKDARAVLVLWSQEALHSQWVRSEADFARNAGKLVQAASDGARPPLPFDQLQFADLSGWRGTPEHPGWRKAEASIAELVGGRPVMAEAQRGRARTPLPGRRTLLGALALLTTLAVIAWVAWPKNQGAELKVAVLPFEAGDASLRSQASGLTDAVISALTEAQVPPVSGDAAQAKDRGGARVLVRATVENGGVGPLVRLKFDDTRNGVTLFSTEIDSEGQTPAALKDQVGARVANDLSRLRRDIGRDTDRFDSASLGDYIRILDKISLGIDHAADNVQTDRDLLAHAPWFSHAHSSLAADLALAVWGQTDPVADQWRAEARREALRGRELNPRDVDAIIALQALEPVSQYAKREAILGEGLRTVGPDPWLFVWTGLTLRAVGRNADAAEAHRKEIGLDPFFPQCLVDNIHVLSMQGRTAAAEAVVERALRSWPLTPTVRRAALYQAVFFAPADKALERLTTLQGADLEPRAAAAWRAFIRDRGTGQYQPATARALLDAVDAHLAGVGEVMMALGAMGRLNDAFELADRVAPGVQSNFPTAALFEPPAASLRRDPRFMRLMNRFGIADYWVETGRYADFCSDPGLPYSCRAEAEKLVKH